MPKPIVNKKSIIFDACTMISLHVTGRIEEILKATLITNLYICEYVHSVELRRINLSNLIHSNLINVVDLTDEEEVTSVNFAAYNNENGEIFSGAIAFHRDWAIATDDRKAIMFFESQVPNLEILTTPELIKYWEDSLSIPQSEVSLCIQNIEKLANYTLSKRHPLGRWWHNHSKAKT